MLVTMETAPRRPGLRGEDGGKEHPYAVPCGQQALSHEVDPAETVDERRSSHQETTEEIKQLSNALCWVLWWDSKPMRHRPVLSSRNSRFNRDKKINSVRTSCRCEGIVVT